MITPFGCSSNPTHISIMKKSQLINSYVFLLILTLSFSVSWGALSSILDVSSTSEDFVTCLQSHSNNFTAISQVIFTPNNASFIPIWGARVNNLRFNKTSTPKPSVIVTPNDENQIRTTLLCCKKHGYEMRIRGGGHDFEGLSSTADVPFVMLDLSNRRTVDVDVESATAWVQSGAVLGEVYYAISQKTDKLYFPAGICPTVGTGGYLSGAGYGNLQRKYGLGGDNVLDVIFMDVNGRILNRKSMGEDLFWSLRGGGASSFGIVLAWKLNLVEVPERVTVFVQNLTLEQGAAEVLYKYQFVSPTTDRGLSIRAQLSSQYIGNTTKKTVGMLFFGLYQGPMDTLLPLLNETFPELNVTKDICEEVTMAQASLVFATFPSNTSTAVLASRNAIQKLNGKNKLDYVRAPIPRSGLKKLFKKMYENDGSELVILHPFGGIMEEISETALPYPHRAGILYQINGMVRFDGEASDTTPASLRRISWLKSYYEFMTPYVSKNPREAYLNYNDLDLGVASDTFEEASVWGDKYWKRENFKKLIRIKAKVDPTNFFKHAQSIPVFTKSVSDM